MKKSTAMILAFMFISVSVLAQSRVDAKDILKSIDDGKAVSYRGVEIVGDLDLTSIQDKEADKNNKRSRNSTEVFWYRVRSPLTFIDCTFKGDVIAYYHDERKNETHNAVFHDDVSFQGCEFQGKSAFKYSKFYEGADFSKTTYRREALFKYTKFSTEVSFAGSLFAGVANFKYTDFPRKADFANAKFSDDAIFKYTDFPHGVSFKNTVFQGDADFKYSEFCEPFDFDGTEFEDSVDFKYTKLEGKSFTRYLLKNRK
jgi:uncharacterized protein YjbI with pentapeptide repeats